MKSDGKISTSGLQPSSTPSSFKYRHSAADGSAKKDDVRMFNPQAKPPLQFVQKPAGG